MSVHFPTRARLALVALGALLASACAPARSADALDGPAAERAPLAVFETATGRRLALDELAGELAGADVALFGEQHDDPGTHRAQAQLLRALGDRGAEVVVGMEMFERDVQPALDAYLAGRTGEVAFLAASRPWPNYREAYREIVEVARERGGRVVGTNVPQAIAGLVAETGLEALAGLDASQRALAAAELRCPKDEYYRRFVQAMGIHPPPAGGAGEKSPMDRLYEAQCLRDETMAETIVRERPAGALLVHLNGGFHSDHRLGIAPRLLRRDPALRLAVLTAVPVADPARGDHRRYRDVADFVLFTLRP